MSLYPIRNPWWSRPGWSEWRDWRNGGPNHDGLDMYTRRGTAIYATGNGVVVRKGFHRPAPRVGHGHFIAIQYGNVEVSYSHMLAASPYAVGARVDASTRVGQVGDTGSAEGVDWVVGSPTGSPLQHVHVEVRLFGTLINPRIHFDSLSLASGGGTTPITPPAPTPTRMIRSRKVQIIRLDGSTRVFAISPELRGQSAEERGYFTTTDQTIRLGLARTWADGAGNEKVEPQAALDTILAAARASHDAYLRALQGNILTATRNAVNQHTTDRAAEVIAEVKKVQGGTTSGSFTASDRTILTGLRDTLNRIFK